MNLKIRPAAGFCDEMIRRSGDNFRRCLQCLSCAGGCPVRHAMTYGPNGILRLVQFGLKRQVLECPDIWLCLGCHSCSIACPMAIDIAAVMDALREAAVAEGIVIAEPGILNFHEEVIDSIRRHGRAHKLEIMLRYKLRQRDFFSDVDVGLKMLIRRKLDLKPHKISAIERIRELLPRPGRLTDAIESID